MTTKKDKKNEIKPLDMTTDEAMIFLFPKEAVEELKRIANEPKRQTKASKNGDNVANDDSSYKYNNKQST